MSDNNSYTKVYKILDGDTPYVKVMKMYLNELNGFPKPQDKSETIRDLEADLKEEEDYIERRRYFNSLTPRQQHDKRFGMDY